MTDKIIEKLLKIVETNKPKNITIKGKTYYISRKKINEIKKIQEEHKGGDIIPALTTALPILLGALKEKSTKEPKQGEGIKTEHDLYMKIIKIATKGKPKTIRIKGNNINITNEHIKKVRDIASEREPEGGFLPALIAALPLIFGALSAAGAVTGGVATAIKAASGDGLHLNPFQGNGLFLNPYNMKGEGLYLSPYFGEGIVDILKTFVKDAGLEKEAKKALKNTLLNIANNIKEGNGIIISVAPKL